MKRLSFLIKLKKKDKKNIFKMILKEIAIDQRPRERLKSKGVDSLNDSEILALLLEKGTNGENVIDLSHRLISTFGLERSYNICLVKYLSCLDEKIAR